MPFRQEVFVAAAVGVALAAWVVALRRMWAMGADPGTDLGAFGCAGAVGASEMPMPMHR